MWRATCVVDVVDDVAGVAAVTVVAVAVDDGDFSS